MAINKTGKSESMLSNNPDKADKTGFLHGARVIFKKVRAILYNYANKDGVAATNDDGSEVQAPGLMVTYSIKGTDATQDQFYANGPSGQRVPTANGHGFKAAPGAKVGSSLVEGSNAYLLCASLKGAGFPAEQFTGDYSVFEGVVADMIAQPLGQSKRALAEGAQRRTIPVVANIVSMPGGETTEDEAEEGDEEEEAPAAKPVKKAKPAPVEEEEEEEEVEEEEEEAEEPSDALTETAQEYVATVLDSKKYRGKSLDLDTLAKEVLILSRTDKDRKKIVALVQDPAFHADAPWTYSKKSKTISADTE